MTNFEQFSMVAKTFKGLENVLAEELTRLGANDIVLDRRAVSFRGDKQLLYRANLWLRTASRVLVPILHFTAKDTDTIYEKVKKYDWTQWIGAKQSFSINTTCYSDYFRHSQFLAYRVKDAIVDSFKDKGLPRPNINTDTPDIYLQLHASQNHITLSLDSSGESLHKRGWRTENTAAPLNEALAAGLILLSGWKGDRDFYDPMCGSGTLLIEAAMIAKNIPPGIYRTDFAFEHWHDFNKEMFETIYNDDSEERELKCRLYGSDSSFFAIKKATENIRSAGLKNDISLRQIEFQHLPKVEQPSLLLTNPPYGERMQPEDIAKLYSDLGTCLKHTFAGSEAWVLSANKEAMKHIALKPKQKISVLNGDLDCTFQQYELFEGKRKEQTYHYNLE
ncbi:MAG: RNA methyltransferase [Paludibacteraceae bacterium]|nr:RNA methyltransferase [Paludibacteraceae bacterium]